MAALRTAGMLGPALALLLAAAAARADEPADDRHAGYYYPALTSEETYRARARTLEDASRDKRIGFVVAHTLGQASRPYPPRYALFAKGDQAEKLILVGLEDQTFATLFRARAVLAQLTAVSRSTELFRNLAVEDYFTFFDLLKLLGFTQLTVSDGETYAHRVSIE